MSLEWFVTEKIPGTRAHMFAYVARSFLLWALLESDLIDINTTSVSKKRRNPGVEPEKDAQLKTPSQFSPKTLISSAATYKPLQAVPELYKVEYSMDIKGRTLKLYLRLKDNQVYCSLCSATLLPLQTLFSDPYGADGLMKWSRYPSLHQSFQWTTVRAQCDG